MVPGKVAIYIRWSTEDQGEGTTLDVQLEGCRHYLLSQGWPFSPDLVFVDDGYSGGTLDRPALKALRARVAAGGVDCVVVYKLDRLSRNVVDTVNLVLREWEGKCHLKSARENIDTLDHAGKMFFYTLVSFAEWERNTIRDRTLAGRVRRAQEGRNPGRTLPYGYATGARPGQVVVLSGEAEVVRRIFREYLAGSGVRTIAAGLNGDGRPGPRGGRWSGPTVARMLANETYLGTLRFAPGRGQAPVVVEGAFPAIIGAEEFQRAQANRKSRPSTAAPGVGRALASPYLLSGLLVCGLCGATMRCRPPYDRAHGLYFCLARFHGGAAACGSAHIRQPDLDARVVAELRRRYGDPGRREGYMGRHLEAIQGEAAGLTADLEAVRRSLGRLEAEEAHVRRHFRQKAITVAEYRLMSDDLRREAEALRAQEQALGARLGALAAARTGQGAVLAAARRIDHWERLTPAEQKNVLRFFVSQVRAVRRTGSSEVQVEITWKTPD